MMIARRKILVVLLTTIALWMTSARTGYPVGLVEGSKLNAQSQKGNSRKIKTCKVISPKRFQKLHFFPVNIVVQFGQEARPGTFMALLNGIDITARFKEIEKGVSALVGPEDGLRIEVKADPHKEMNVLRTTVKGLKPEQHVDFDTFFFVEVDELISIGPKGGVVRTKAGHILMDIPHHALSSVTAIALTKVQDTGQIGSVYQVSPDGLNLNKPVTVAMKYKPSSLPEGVIEDDLFLISGNEFPQKTGNPFVDKSGHSVSGTIMSFSRVFVSCYAKIGKKLTDIPEASDFRLPIGDESNASYTCGDDYQSPSENDIGETLTLLHRSSYSNFDYPKIIFNADGPNNTWQVIMAFDKNRYVNSASGPTKDSNSFFREDGDLFSNGEDWNLAGHGNDAKGLPIHAIADGLVIHNGWGHGNTVVLAHQAPLGPILSVYSLMDEKSPCAVGTVVHEGNVIGKIGRIGTGHAYLHYEIGKESLIEVDAKTGEIKVPATWLGKWKQDSVYENYYDPTNFLFNIAGKYEWGFNINGNDEGWIAKNVKEYENGCVYEVKDGMLSVKPRSSNFCIKSYPLKIEAKGYDSVFVRMRSNTADGHGRVYFATDEEPEYSEDKAVEFEVLNPHRFHEYRVFMADIRKWKGTIVGIRIDFPDTVIGEATEIKFDNIKFGRAYLSRTRDTGQVKCYDDNQEINCPVPGDPFYGQDAHYVINPPGYEVKTINGDEVVTDRVTGLTWQRHEDGKKRTWREAMDYCENLTIGGYPDWRLPTKKELQSIIDYSFFGPALDTACFPYSYQRDDYYWSATIRVFLSVFAWKVSFWDGQVKISNEGDYNYVRAVRGRTLEYCHFRDNGDGTVTDTATGLMWYQTETKAMTWEKSLAFCEKLDFAGYDDWRLPNIRELLSLVDDSRRAPSIDTVCFPGCRPYGYWSSTTNTLYPGFAWYVGFNDGRVYGGGLKDRRHYVRPVRGG